MGGVTVETVNGCDNFMTAEQLDAAVDNYIINGLMDETDTFIYYSWWWWGMYIWNLNT